MGIREAGGACDGGPLRTVSFPQGWEQPFWSRASHFPNFCPALGPLDSAKTAGGLLVFLLLLSDEVCISVSGYFLPVS